MAAGHRCPGGLSGRHQRAPRRGDTPSARGACMMITSVMILGGGRV